MNTKHKIIYPVDRRFLDFAKNQQVKPNLVFLAGPIRHSPDWQSQAIEILDSSQTEFAIANPRRPHFETQEECEKAGAVWFLYDKYQRTDWELDHLVYSRENGVALFYFAKPDSHDCNYPYAQTSRVELGMMLGHNAHSSGNIVIGIEQGFPGEEYIRYLVSSGRVRLGKGSICNTLQQSCRSVIDIIDNA